MAGRYQFTKESQVFDLEGPLYEDIFLIDKYLVNGVDIHLKLFRNRAAFCIMSSETTPNYKIELPDVVFKECMIQVDSGVVCLLPVSKFVLRYGARHTWDNHASEASIDRSDNSMDRYTTTHNFGSGRLDE